MENDGQKEFHILNTVPTFFFFSDFFLYLSVPLLLLYFFAGTTSSSRTFKFLPSKTNKTQNKSKTMKIISFDSCFVSLGCLCVFSLSLSLSLLLSIPWCLYSKFVNVGKRFIIVHGNYVECSHFLSIHCYFEKDHHDFILWLVTLITIIYIEEEKKNTHT